MPGVLQAVVAGDVRRRTEVVRDLVLVREPIAHDGTVSAAVHVPVPLP